MLGNHNEPPWLPIAYTFMDFPVFCLLDMAKIALTDPYFELHYIMTQTES